MTTRMQMRKVYSSTLVNMTTRLPVCSKPVSAQAEALSDILIKSRNMFIPTKEITLRPNNQSWTNTYTR